MESGVMLFSWKKDFNRIKTKSSFMKKLLAVIIIVLTSGVATAQNSFSEEMKSALDLHDKAKTVTQEIESLEAFKKLISKYDDEWLPSYWAAYLCTQIARLDGVADGFPNDLSGKDFLTESEEYLTITKKRLTSPSDNQLSDLYTLEGFIYSFYPSIMVKSKMERDMYRLKSKIKYDKAIRLNPRNPLMYVLEGVNHTSKADEIFDLTVAIALFDQAERIFLQESNRALTTYWAKDFLRFWRAQAEKKINEYDNS